MSCDNDAGWVPMKKVQSIYRLLIHKGGDTKHAQEALEQSYQIVLTTMKNKPEDSQTDEEIHHG